MTTSHLFLKSCQAPKIAFFSYSIDSIQKINVRKLPVHPPSTCYSNNRDHRWMITASPRQNPAALEEPGGHVPFLHPVRAKSSLAPFEEGEDSVPLRRPN